MSQRTCLPLHKRTWAPMHGHRRLVVTRRRTTVIAPALKGVLCDLDGVIYASGSSTVIPGATETLQYLREHQIPWCFVTNTCTKNREGLAARLRDMGIACTAEDIVSPAKLAADWLRSHNAGPTALFVAPELYTEFEGVPLLPPTAEAGADAVVIGDMGLDWNYSQLNRAFRLVMEGELRLEAAHTSMPQPHCESSSGNGKPNHPAQQAQAPEAAPHHQAEEDGARSGAGGRAPGPLTLISLGKGRYYKDSDGYSIDVGPFTSAIEFATDTKAVVLGKPDPLIFCLAARSLGLEPEEVVMIGDDVRGDVGGAQAAGLRGVLVRTGKFRQHDLSVGITPDAVLPSVADFPAWWEAQQQLQHKQVEVEVQEQLQQEQELQQVVQQQEQLQQEQVQQQQVEVSLGRSKPARLAVVGA
ncbi:hypothetical protein PLESTF_000207700 [Pleodorina starrii]|nr:hypothetical protein PLESTF_000207700 [Pleodorina starrii]